MKVCMYIYVIKPILLCYICDRILTNWDTVIPIKLEPIILFKLPIMLLSISQKLRLRTMLKIMLSRLVEIMLKISFIIPF